MGLGYIPPPYQHLLMVHTDNNFNDGFSTIDTLVNLSFWHNIPDTLCYDDTLSLPVRITGTSYTGDYNIRIFVTYTNAEYISDNNYYYYNVPYDSTVIFKLHAYGTNYDSMLVYYTLIPSDSLSRPTVYNPYPPAIVHFIDCDTNSIAVMPSASPYLRVYPNPANDRLQVEYINLTGTGSLKIYSLKGRLIKTIPVPEKMGLKQIDVSDLPAGVYILSYTTANSKTAVKFNIER